MPRGITQPAQGQRAGRVWSRDLVLDCRMSRAVQPYQIFTSPSKKACAHHFLALALTHSSEALSLHLYQTCHYCGPFTTPAHSLPQLREGTGQSSRVWLALRELRLQPSPDTDVSGFCKPLPLYGYRRQKGPWSYLLETRQVHLPPKYVPGTFPIPGDFSRQGTNNSSPNKFRKCWVKQSLTVFLLLRLLYFNN